MKILIADDDNTDRLILKTILIKSDHEVLSAENGLEAVELFKSEAPDLILLDALMPIMNGYDAAVEIKMHAGDRMIPIIFLTSLRESSELARCLEVGGDDVLTKPYNRIILQAKIKAFERLKVLYDEISRQKNEIQFYSDHMHKEQEVAKRVFDNIAHSGNLKQPNIKYLLSPMSVFNGDILLSSNSPSGCCHIMLGDFTGHGLPAAIGAMPVADIFYSMTGKGFSISDIATEMNERLSSILPIGVFCCATICEVNYRDKSLTIWSGGLPDSYILRPDVGLVESIKSKHLPLGVLKAKSFIVETEVIPFELDDTLYVFSDGILEAESPTGEMFGEQRILDLISSSESNSSLFNMLISSLKEFSQTKDQNDDLTLIEYRFDEASVVPHSKYTDIDVIDTVSLDWSLQYEFRGQTLGIFDPLPLVLQILLECPNLKPYRGRVYTILSELYSNAVDHGVLGLDSSLKQSSESFAEYYNQRQLKLAALTSGYVKIKMDHVPHVNGGNLIIEVEDSGLGFNRNDLNSSENQYSGRGLKLLSALCQSVEHSDDGRIIKVIYQWGGKYVGSS